jgi:hypothetical protein
MLSSPLRQAAVAVVGIVLVGLGLAGPWRDAGAAKAHDKPALAEPKAEVTGLAGIDLRSSNPDDTFAPGTGSGQLLATIDIAVRNVSQPAGTLTWQDTIGKLVLGTASVPFRSHYFTNLTGDEKNWLGKEPQPARPVAIDAGQVVQREIMFAPQNAGAGPYKWSDFTAALFRPGAPNPVFEATVLTRIGEREGTPRTLRCTVPINESMADIRRGAAAHARHVWITLPCTTGGG